MKIFIVFTALLLVFCSFFVFTSDMMYYRNLQSELKMLSEELACGAALLTGDKYNHSAVIRQSDALAYIEFMVSYQSEHNRRLRGGELSCSVEFPGESSLNVSLEFKPSRSLFSMLPGVTPSVKRSSSYEWVQKS